MCFQRQKVDSSHRLYENSRRLSFHFYPPCLATSMNFHFHGACAPQKWLWSCKISSLRPIVTGSTWPWKAGMLRMWLSQVAQLRESTDKWSLVFLVWGWMRKKLVTQYLIWKRLCYWFHSAWIWCYHGLLFSRVALRSGLSFTENSVEAERDRLLEVLIRYEVESKQLEKFMLEKGTAMKAMSSSLLDMERSVATI